MNKYIINSDGLSLSKNEVLIIKEVVSARVKFGRSKSELRVFSMLSHKQLVLPKECDAGFTTDMLPDSPLVLRARVPNGKFTRGKCP